MPSQTDMFCPKQLRETFLWVDRSARATTAGTMHAPWAAQNGAVGLTMK